MYAQWCCDNQFTRRCGSTKEWNDRQWWCMTRNVSMMWDGGMKMQQDCMMHAYSVTYQYKTHNSNMDDGLTRWWFIWYFSSQQHWQLTMLTVRWDTCVTLAMTPNVTREEHVPWSSMRTIIIHSSLSFTRTRYHEKGNHKVEISTLLLFPACAHDIS